MKKRIYKKKKGQIIRGKSNNISREQMIEIQTEAYYRALKKIQNEKNEENKKMIKRNMYGMRIFY